MLIVEPSAQSTSAKIIDQPFSQDRSAGNLCTAHLPAPMSFSQAREKTYSEFLGPLGTSRPSIMAECLFVDPTTDIAVFGGPDGQTSQEFDDASRAFDKFIHKTKTLSMSTRKMGTPVTGWLLSLDGHWTRCTITTRMGLAGVSRVLWVTEAMAGIRGGMSGSPTLLDDGKVIGVCVCASWSLGEEVYTEGGPHPRLMHHLPGWIVKALKMSVAELVK
jgi:hypothetical protein